MKPQAKAKMEARETPAFDAALFGKFASDPQAREIMSNVATWPKSKSELADHLGNYAQIVRWKPGIARATDQRDARQKQRKHPYSPEEIQRIGRRMRERAQRCQPSLKELLEKHFLEARIHPAVDWLLDIIIPALCDQNPQPFRLLARAIEAQNSAAFPDNALAFTTLQTAFELSGHPMPFNATGEPADVDIDIATGEPADVDTKQPKIRVPVLNESDLRREVERRLGRKEGSLNPG